MSIIDLQETSQNVWKAKYRGNYGTYNIKIETDGKKRGDFSCSCPSDYYPCKHIPIVEEAIRERIAKKEKSNSKNEIPLEQLLKDVPHKELCNFIANQAQYNPQLKNTILLEFSHIIKKKETENVNYNQILQNALDGFYFDFEDINYGHYDDCIELDVMDQWLDKAQEYVDQNNPEEALLICKACIEEYAAWCQEIESEVVEFVKIDYQITPFDIIEQMLPMPKVDGKQLLGYCKSEMVKPKYKKTELYDGFSKLFMKLSTMVGSDDFIALQDKLLQEVGDNSSYEAKTILQRKIDFYQNNKQPDKADEIIRENLQIESFRELFTKKMIAENKLQEAKKLIQDFILQKGNENRYLRSWKELQLQIAQKEKDIPETRRISFQFIESGFDVYYYNIYKSAFSKEEWVEKMENLIKHYEKKYNSNWFNPSVADVLKAEKQKERLMKYIEKHLSVDCLEKYHTDFSVSFPEKTLALFRQAIDKYAQNTGRTIYEHIVRLFGKMVKIEGGSQVVREMITQYRILYKNRSAMMETITIYTNDPKKQKQ